MEKRIPHHPLAAFRTEFSTLKGLRITSTARLNAQELGMTTLDVVAMVKTMSSAHFYSWKKGLKTGMYYLRTKAAADAIKFTVDQNALSQPAVQVLGNEDALLVERGQAHVLSYDEHSSYDLIVSNPPYVSSQDPHLAALAHEPLSALAAGPDGLADIRTIVAQTPARLKPGGWLLLEHGWDQAEAVRSLLRAAGFDRVASRRDLTGIERCSGGQRLELG